MIREIQKLVSHLERRRAEKEAYKKSVLVKEEREQLIRTAKAVMKLEFWCDDCASDFQGFGVKCIEKDWTAPGMNIAFYKAKCPHGHKAIRRITDKPLDPYFIKSLTIQRQRKQFAKDTLQYGDYGFKLLYGDVKQSI